MPGPEVCRALMELVTAEASDLKRKKSFPALLQQLQFDSIFISYSSLPGRTEPRMPSLVSYSCNIGSVDRVGLGDSAQLQNAYLLFSVGLP